MITVISDQFQIDDLHREFHKKLANSFKEKIHCRIGYPGGSMDAYVNYSQDFDLWVGTMEATNRFWNGFGHGRPISWNSNSISGEINFPYAGVNRRIAAVFAEEQDGSILVLHRGKIGGGKAGIGKNFFTDNFSGDFVDAIDGDRESRFCLVGELDSPHFALQVASFINEIRRVKDLASDEASPDFSDLQDYVYTDEKHGISLTERSEPVKIERVHGIIVNALRNKLTDMGFLTGNDSNRDLFVHHHNTINTLFEVKTTSSTQCLYAAVGQLLIYSIPMPAEVKLIAVFPEKLNAKVTRRLHSFGIELLHYKWKDNEPVFESLHSIMQ